METINMIQNSLAATPKILTNLLSSIPSEKYKLQRISGKWSLHEQVCHLVDAQQILIERFKIFENEEHPHIKNYDPHSADAVDKYLKMDMNAALDSFPTIRNEMIEMLKSYPDSYWNKTGTHENFEPYGTRILLIHCLNVDYAHLFSIEQLGLTKYGKEDEIMVVP